MKKRFYDQEPHVSQAVELLLVFPDEMQSVVADGLALIAERECQANELMNDFKSLGSEKVLAIYKSKQRKRRYDNNPNVHRAMNYLMILSEENRVFVCRKIVELMGYMQEYLKTCKTYSLNPQVAAIEALTDTYVKLGADESRNFLKNVESEFIRKLKGQETAEAPAEDKPPKKGEPTRFAEAIQDEGLGMRIRGGFQ